MTDRLRKQLAFILELDQEKNILRQTHLSNHGRRENDAEHAWHMAIMAYLLQEYSNAPIDVAKVMLMCLLHDVVEIDAGDTYAYDEKGKETQKARETAESKFAHAMDNLQPLLLNDSNNGGDWKAHRVTAEQVYGRQSQTKDGSEVLFEWTDAVIQKNIAAGNIQKES